VLASTFDDYFIYHLNTNFELATIKNLPFPPSQQPS
jgi:hypothetical protein